mgnify:CR=1 FL=1
MDALSAGVWAIAAALSAAVAAEPEPNVEASPPVEAVEAPEAEGVARLRGRVLVYGDRDPAAGARLLPKDGSTPIETGEDGGFSADLPPGDYAFIVRAPGFDDLEVNVALVDGQDLQMEYFLQPSLEGERYRTVVEQQQAVAVSNTRLEGREIHEVPGTRGDPLSVVATLPGASRLAGFLPYIVVRGAAPGNTGYYLDGARVPILYHVAIGPSVIHPYFIDGVEFYPGSAPVRLGRFTSGLIEATTRPARRDRVHGEVDVRITDAGGLVEVPISRPVLDRECRRTKKRKECEKGDPRGALTLAGRYSYTAGVLSLVNSSARIQFWDYQARFDHDLGRRARYTAFAYGSYDDLGERASGGTPAETFVRFNFHRFDNRVRQRLRGGGTATYAVVLGLDTSGLSNYFTREYRVAPRVDYRIPTRFKTLQVGLGLDQEFQVFRTEVGDADGDASAADLGLFFSDRFVSATGGYAELIFDKGKVQVRPGLRADFYGQIGRSPYVFNTRAYTSAFGVDPRLLMRERLNDRWTLKQAIGLYHQPPTFPIPVPGVESFGFERGLQRNAQTSFGYEFIAIPGLLNVEQEAYVGYLSNLQDYELEQENEDNPINELEDVISTVTGWAYGLETLVKLDPQLRVFGWVAYTLSRATRNYEIGGRAPASWDQRHILNVVLGYRISQKWNFGGRVHYHTGRPWTARDENETQADALRNRRNNARLPPYFQLDLRVERIWRWPKWQMSLALDISNATYARETFACTEPQSDEPGLLGSARNGSFVAPADPARGIVQCTPQGFRYIVPSLGLRARW